MIVPDANLLIYAYSPADPFHEASRLWLEDILSGSEAVGIPSISIHAFMRVQTDRRGRSPVSFQQAAETVDTWLNLPHVRILYPGDRHWILFQQLASQARMTGTDLTDAAIAAIAQEHGGTVHTNDGDFARFPNLSWHNPLTTS
jgi:toxin-antitoxin system PIN domain toxin